jgi:ADP-heptose:LPS heptosyltransferase
MWLMLEREGLLLRYFWHLNPRKRSMNLAAKQWLDALAGNWLMALHQVLARTMGFMLRRDHTFSHPPRTILVIKILGMGSVILAAESIVALRKRYPEAKLILLCGQALKPGLEPLGLFDEIWDLPDNSLPKLLAITPRLFWRIWRLPRLWVMDLEVYSRLTTLFSLYTCAVNRYGFYLNEVQFRHNIYTHTVYFNQFVHAGLNYQRLAEAMGAREADFGTAFSLPNLPPRKSDVNMDDFGFIAVNNTCSELSLERKMPPTLLADLLLGLRARYPKHTIALMGAPSDKAEMDAFLKQYVPEASQMNVLNYAGHFKLADYYRFLHAECAAMITIDSMPLHVSRLLGLPVVSIWGPTNPTTLIQANDRDRVLYLGVSCSPCVHHTDILPCGGDNFCMKRQEAASILQALESLLAQPANLPA